MSWAWDLEKAAGNLAKHGVSFELAARVFDDPFSLTYPDPHEDEERWRTIGRPSSESPVTLVVVHTWPDKEAASSIGRIISARRAERHERKAYEEGES